MKQDELIKILKLNKTIQESKQKISKFDLESFQDDFNLLYAEYQLKLNLMEKSIARTIEIMAEKARRKIN